MKWKDLIAGAGLVVGGLSSLGVGADLFNHYINDNKISMGLVAGKTAVAVLGLGAAYALNKKLFDFTTPVEGADITFDEIDKQLQSAEEGANAAVKPTAELLASAGAEATSKQEAKQKMGQQTGAMEPYKARLGDIALS